MTHPTDWLPEELPLDEREQPWDQEEYPDTEYIPEGELDFDDDEED